MPWRVPMQARDPIPMFAEWAVKEGLLTEGKIKELQQSVMAEVEEAVKFADESPKPVRNRRQNCTCCRPSLVLRRWYLCI